MAPPASPSFKNSLRGMSNNVVNLWCFRSPCACVVVASHARIIPRHLLRSFASYTDQSTAEPVAGASAERPILVVHRGYLQSREGVRMRILPKERKVPAP
jgi:hypothetical protein